MVNLYQISWLTRGFERTHGILGKSIRQAIWARLEWGFYREVAKC